jgi:hypothetical protein
MPETDSTLTVKHRPHHLEIKDYIGQKYGRLTVLGEAERNPRSAGHQRVVCECECGNKTSPPLSALLRTSGGTKSCGCRKGLNKHGHAKDGAPSRVYGIWHSMLQRCNNPNARNYHNYGGRGIKVCPEWHDFKGFLASMGEPPSDSHTLDRLNNSGAYEPSNCEWRTWSEQMRNTRQNRYLTFKDQTLCMTEWAEITGLKRNTIEGRLASGWSVEEALTTPALPKSQRRAGRPSLRSE